MVKSIAYGTKRKNSVDVFLLATTQKNSFQFGNHYFINKGHLYFTNKELLWIIPQSIYN